MNAPLLLLAALSHAAISPVPAPPPQPGHFAVVEVAKLDPWLTFEHPSKGSIVIGCERRDPDFGCVWLQGSNLRLQPVKGKDKLWSDQWGGRWEYKRVSQALDRLEPQFKGWIVETLPDGTRGVVVLKDESMLAAARAQQEARRAEKQKAAAERSRGAASGPKF